MAEFGQLLPCAHEPEISARTRMQIFLAASSLPASAAQVGRDRRESLGIIGFSFLRVLKLSLSIRRLPARS